MASHEVPDELLIQALNLIEEHGSEHLARLAGATDVPRATLRHRAQMGRIKGLKPTVHKDAPRIYTRERLGRMHLIIPDVQMKHGVRNEHMTWIGRFIADKRPDVVIQIGDFADMESLNTYHKPREREGKRYNKDIAAVKVAMDLLTAPFRDLYKPRKVLCMGNHEARIVRFVDEHPEFEDKVSLDDLPYRDFGWEIRDFLEVVTIDQVEYSHYFTSGTMGRPCASAAVQLRERQSSCVAGHVQHTDIAVHKKTGRMAIFCGTCYLHNEPYLSRQDNSQRRQVLVLHEVEGGKFDPMLVSLRFLEKAYG